MKNVMRGLVVAASLLAASVVGSAGCSSDDGGDGGSSEGGDCASFATFLCDKIAECQPLGAQLSYTSKERCQLALRQDCELSVSAPGSKTKPGQPLECVKSNAYTCEALRGGLRGVAQPAACVPPAGELADGAACYSDTQCQSTSCSGSQSACGVCQPLKKSPEGGDCKAADECASPLVCSKKGVCIKALAAGAACDDTDECASPLVCGKDPSSVTGVCKAQGNKKPGEVCADSADCDEAQGSYCRPDKVCSTFRVARGGESCQSDSTGFVVCEASAACLSFTCVVNAQDGEACDEKAGPRCNAPADCVSGKCTLPTAPACQ